MEFQEFLDKVSERSFFDQYCIISFHTGQSCPLFKWHITKLLKQSNKLPIARIDAKNSDYSSILNQLETSFLGSRILYYLSNVDQVDTKKRKKITSYLTGYHGPHVIYYFSTNPIAKKIQKNQLAIRLPDKVDKQFFQLLGKLLKLRNALIKQLIYEVYKKHKTIYLDQACLILEYAHLLGNNIKEFTSSWLNKLIVSERSLFVLSQHFFAKNKDNFFSEWLTLENQYAPVFWTVYWSEQLWRAFHYTQLCHNRHFVDAKKIGFRLPFSFLNRDWKKYKPNELRNAHDSIYAIDFSLKTGGHNYGLELFYNKFFLEQFKNKNTQQFF